MVKLMKNTIRIAVAQMEPLNGDIDANLSKVKEVVTSVNAELYIFPELFLTGYLIEDLVFKLALDLDSKPIKELQQVSNKHRVGIVLGFPERSSMGYLYNSALAIDYRGNIYIYRKRHLPTFSSFSEGRWFKSYRGSFNPWLFGTIKVGITICYDIFFPEIFRKYMLNGVELFINISAAPDTSIQLFHILSRARAIENSAYFVWVNTTGFIGGFGFGGASIAVDPLGNILYTLKYYEEDIQVVEINFDNIKKYRIERPLLRDVAFEDYYLLFKNALRYEERQ